MCKFLCKSVSVAILAITNAVFLLLGLALTTTAGYMYASDLSVFFFKGLVEVVLASGLTVLIMSLLGLFGALTQRKRYLCPYTLFVVVCVILQCVGFGLSVNFSHSLRGAEKLQFNSTKYNSATSAVMDWIETNFEHAYEQAQCVRNDDSKLLTCTAADSLWFQKFVNNNCMSQELVDCTAPSAAEATFCECQSVLADKLSVYGITSACIVLSLIAAEVLLLVFVACVYCMGRRRQARQQAPNLDAPLHQQPQQQYFYVQHTSVPPGKRTEPSSAEAVTQASQAISLV
jgi:hypothetical protein